MDTFLKSELPNLEEVYYDQTEKTKHIKEFKEKARQAIEVNDYGCYDSLADYAEELTTSTSEVPEHLSYYIDYDRMGRDMEMSGDIFTVETAHNEVHMFSNC